jgi:hypothetical protein
MGSNFKNYLNILNQSRQQNLIIYNKTSKAFPSLEIVKKYDSIRFNLITPNQCGFHVTISNQNNHNFSKSNTNYCELSVKQKESELPTELVISISDQDELNHYINTILTSDSKTNANLFLGGINNNQTQNLKSEDNPKCSLTQLAKSCERLVEKQSIDQYDQSCQIISVLEKKN